jgi:1-acyl-sn-glycerol-3-phosphate acyltransferase
LRKAGKSTGLLKTLAQYALLYLYQCTFGLYVRLRYRLKCIVHTPLPEKGPFFLLGNHTNNFDGLFLQCFFPRPIRFVVTDGVFKKKLLGSLLRLVDYIPKRKSMNDIAAIRSIMDVVARGGIVGIFPEGGRSWDGVTGSITPATARLIGKLNVPVVAAKISGGYLSEPRWADYKRRGRVEVHLETIVASGDNLSPAEIEHKITEALAHNEFDWQRKARIPFQGRALCRGLERLMFMCPVCGALGSVVSTDDEAQCSACRSRFTLDVFGYLQSDGALLPADSMDKINEWQLRRFETIIDEQPQIPRLMADDDGILFCAHSREEPFRPIDSGKVVLSRSQLMLGRFVFELSGITGINVYFKDQLEFRYHDADYRIGFQNRQVSAYKWQCAVELAKKRITAV